MQTPIINIDNISTKINGEFIHQNLSLVIKDNTVVSVIGKSGCGKTTLLRCILSLQTIQSGTISIFDKNIATCDKKLVFNQIGVLFQRGALFSSMTVLENVMFPLVEFSQFTKNMITKIAADKLRMVGLDKIVENKYPSEISPGMVKRAGLARALMLNPKLLILDEPTAGLDPESAAKFDSMIKALRVEFKFAVFMISHDIDSIWHISDEIVYLDEKTVMFHGAVRDAALQTKCVHLHKYFHGARTKISTEYYLRTNFTYPAIP